MMFYSLCFPVSWLRRQCEEICFSTSSQHTSFEMKKMMLMKMILQLVKDQRRHQKRWFWEFLWWRKSSWLEREGLVYRLICLRIAFFFFLFFFFLDFLLELEYKYFCRKALLNNRSKKQSIFIRKSELFSVVVDQEKHIEWDSENKNKIKIQDTQFQLIKMKTSKKGSR